MNDKSIGKAFIFRTTLDKVDGAQVSKFTLPLEKGEVLTFFLSVHRRRHVL